MCIGGIMPNTVSNLSTATTTRSTSLINSTVTVPPLNIKSHSQPKLESLQDISTSADDSKDIIGAVKERLITKIDPVDMTTKATVVVVPQDTVKRSAMLLSGPKFRLNSKEVLKDKLIKNSNTIYSVSVSSIHKKFLMFDQ
jgi:hypothetical protein